jgi:hypothetical protein
MYAKVKYTEKTAIVLENVKYIMHLVSMCSETSQLIYMSY